MMCVNNAGHQITVVCGATSLGEVSLHELECWRCIIMEQLHNMFFLHNSSRREW